MAFFVRAGRLSIPLNSYIRPNSYGRSISTSKKNDETAAVAEKISSHKPTHGSQDVTAAAAAAVAARKKWTSYGFTSTDEVEDTAATHAVSFIGITICIVISAVLYIYSPDKSLRDWAQREAYLTIREREAKGLPLVDPDYVDASKIILPSEEELGDFEIII